VGHTIKCLTEVEVSLIRCVDYIIESSEQLLSDRSTFEEPELE